MLLPAELFLDRGVSAGLVLMLDLRLDLLLLLTLASLGARLTRRSDLVDGASDFPLRAAAPDRKLLSYVLSLLMLY